MFSHRALLGDLNRLSRLLIVAVAATASFAANAAPVLGQGNWETTLLARDINGDNIVDAYYDTALDLTWLADWNVNGRQHWSTNLAWASGLDVYGVTGWRLPSITDTGSPGCDWSYAGGTDCGYNVDTGSSEMAHMWYVTLGNIAYCQPGYNRCIGPPPHWGLTNTADFLNMESIGYWSGTEATPSTNGAWYFSLNDGDQGIDGPNGELRAVAVRDGDVAAMPEPATFALLGLGLVGITASRRRRLS
jgi:hypothetical protein